VKIGNITKAGKSRREGMAKIRVLKITKKLLGEDDELVQKLKRIGVKVESEKSEEPEKTTARSNEKIIKRDVEKEVVEKRVESKPVEEELKAPQELVQEKAGPAAYYIIDGFNVFHWQRPEPSTAVLLTLIIELCRRRRLFVSVFDANTRFKLGEQDRSVYEILLKTHPNFFHETTGGIRADEVILYHANHCNALIISNDRYRDYQEQYEWLTLDSKRLIKGDVIAGNLMITELDMHVPVKRELPDLLKELSAKVTSLTPLANINKDITN
jgi:hypothetical protein